MPRAVSTTGRHVRWLGPLAIVIATLVGLPTAVHAQQPVIIEPANQSGVRGGEPVAVHGTGCPPGATVDLEVNRTVPVGSTVAGADGSWNLTFVMPIYTIDHTIEEPSEMGLSADCAGLSAAAVIVYNEPLARTGAPLPLVALAPVGLILLLGGAGAVLKASRRTESV